jgi:hypothetical protein
MDLKNQYASGSAVPVDLPSSMKIHRSPAKEKVASPTQADEMEAQVQFHRRADLSRLETNPKTTYPLDWR